MTSVHVWAGAGCIGLHDFPRRVRLLDLPSSLRLNPYYKKQAEKFTQYQDPVIHTSLRRLDYNFLRQISQTVLRDEQSIHFVAITENDVRNSNEYWLADSLEQICSSARLCKKTDIVLLDLIRVGKSHKNTRTRRQVRRVAARFNDVSERIDAASQLRTEELDEFCLTDAGAKLVIEIMAQHLHVNAK